MARASLQSSTAILSVTWHGQCPRLREAAEERSRLIGEWSRRLFRLSPAGTARRDNFNQRFSHGLLASLYSSVVHTEDTLTSMEYQRTVVSRPLSGGRRTGAVGRRAGPGISACTLSPPPGGPPAAQTGPGFPFTLRGLAHPGLPLPIHRPRLNCDFVSSIPHLPCYTVSRSSLGIMRHYDCQFLLGPVAKCCG